MHRAEQQGHVVPGYIGYVLLFSKRFSLAQRQAVTAQQTLLSVQRRSVSAI